MTVENESRRNGGKSGCRSIACASCAGVLILAVMAGVLLLIFAGRVGDASAWERLPRSVFRAVEARDAKGFVRRVSQDTAAMTLLEDWIKNSGDVGLQRDFDEYAASAIAWNDRARFTGSFFVPDSIIVGELGTERDGYFYMLRAPAWQRWLFSAWSWFAQGRYAVIPECDLYGFQRDGWLILAVTETTLDEIAGAWPEAAAVFGPETDVAAPFVQMAARTEPNATPAPQSETDTPPSAPLMLSDPFAPSGGNADPAPSVEAATVRLLLAPTGEGWRLDGAGRLGQDAPPRFISGKEEERSGLTPAGYDFAAAVVTPPALAEEWRQALFSRLPPAASPAAVPPWEALGRLWLERGWLEQTSGTFFLLASPPAVEDTDGNETALLPAFSLGWLWKQGIPPKKAAIDFDDSLAAFLASLTGPGGPPPMEALGRHIVQFGPELADGMEKGGMIDLPAVLANGVKPCWRVSWNPDFPGGWLAGNASGLPSAREAKALFHDMSREGLDSRTATATAGWNFSAAFLDALFGVWRERMDTLPHDLIPNRGAWLQAADFAERLLHAYPRGDAVAEYDAGGNSFRLRGFFHGDGKTANP